MHSLSFEQLRGELASGAPPLLVDVRRRAAWLASSERVPGALRRDPEALVAEAAHLPRGARVVVFCAHGRDVSQKAADELARLGFEAAFLAGGLEGGWKAGGGALEAKPTGASTRWVTRARPKIDRIACPWLVKRFVDPEAEFLFVPPVEVPAVARASGATPFDVPDVPFSHQGERCSFDAFLAHFRLRDAALLRLATVVRGADTGELSLAPECAGLLAVSLGLTRLFADDQELLRQGLQVYDALYAWCRDGQGESHRWDPLALAR